jgi:hypothetical protein
MFIPDPGTRFFSIPDPGVKKAQDTGYAKLGTMTFLYRYTSDYKKKYEKTVNTKQLCLDSNNRTF